MRSDYLVLVLLASVITIMLIGVPALADGFRPIDIKVPVGDWFPALLDQDGTWDIAIRTAENPIRVGVYDPEHEVWIDGPRVLSVSGQNWGAADYDGDGRIEYVYLAPGQVRLCDPDIDCDSALWSTPPLLLKGAVFFGASSNTGLIYADGSAWPYWADRLSLRTLMEGDSLETIKATQAPRFYTAGYGAMAKTDLVLSYTELSLIEGPLGYCVGKLSCNLNFHASEWAFDGTLEVLPQSDVDCYSGEWVTPRSLGQATLGSGLYLTLVNGQNRPDMLIAFAEGQEVPLWSHQMSIPDPYTGVAGFDLDDSGQDSWILPLNSGMGWERRDLTTGGIIDTIPNMPAADLHTGPLFAPDQRTLFYIAGSIINIWGTPTSVGDDQAPDVASLPRDPSLFAYPNPFNAGVRLTWNHGRDVNTMRIFNVLGQEVRRFDLEDETTTSLEWNAKDAQGRDLPSGLYFAQLTGRKTVETVKLVLLK